MRVVWLLGMIASLCTLASCGSLADASSPKASAQTATALSATIDRHSGISDCPTKAAQVHENFAKCQPQDQ